MKFHELEEKKKKNTKEEKKEEQNDEKVKDAEEDGEEDDVKADMDGVGDSKDKEKTESSADTTKQSEEPKKVCKQQVLSAACGAYNYVVYSKGIRCRLGCHSSLAWPCSLTSVIKANELSLSFSLPLFQSI